MKCQELMDCLDKEANEPGSWWSDILNDPKVFIAVREDYLNVYWRGHSLFLVKLGASGLVVTTHPKYLLEPALHKQVPLVGTRFEVDWLQGQTLITQYKGANTLEKMRSAADLFTEPEKKGCHDVISKNSNVIDCEIAFPRTGSDSGAPRVDLLTLEELGPSTARLAFWEAKDFSNPDLRADLRVPSGVAPVCDQIKRYRHYLCEYRDTIEASYKRVVEHLSAIKKMGWKRPLSILIREVAEGKRSLTLGTEPKVGLIVFGFGEAQRNDPYWQKHRERLDAQVAPVIAAGKATNIRL